MESADLGVMLDSSVAIEAEREQLNVADFLRRIAVTIGEREVALSVITVAELAHGIYRADTPDRRERRRLFLDELKAAVMVYPITEITAELVGRIGAESAAKGVTIPFDDLLIGACALERGYVTEREKDREFWFRAHDNGITFGFSTEEWETVRELFRRAWEMPELRFAWDALSREYGEL